MFIFSSVRLLPENDTSYVNIYAKWVVSDRPGKYTHSFHQLHR